LIDLLVGLLCVNKITLCRHLIKFFGGPSTGNSSLDFAADLHCDPRMLLALLCYCLLGVSVIM